ncbi:hypothetical protein ASF80_09070 [Microbacterium sp. Leaf159]|nr:hypothetical protein ASF80_09070 [Microbacterium sp. Leaf159]
MKMRSVVVMPMIRPSSNRTRWIVPAHPMCAATETAAVAARFAGSRPEGRPGAVTKVSGEVFRVDVHDQDG